MQVSPRFVGPLIGLITSAFTSVIMSFISLAINYGFRPDFAERWLKAAATGYIILVPIMMLLIPRIQRVVLGWAGQAPAGRPAAVGASYQPRA